MDTTHPTMHPPAQPSQSQPLYQRLASHYRSAIHAGSLVPGDRMPSLRGLMRQHDISLSTALQLSRHLESEGWLEARPRSGYFVKRPLRSTLAKVSEPRMDVTHVVDAVLFMAGLPLDANVQFLTVMATKMPFIGRG